MKGRTKIYILLFLLIVFTISMACTISSREIKKGTILLVDDFTEKDNHWKIWSKEGESAVSKVGNKLTMILQVPDTDIISTNHIFYPDVEMSIDVQKEHGSNDNLIGLVCRYQDDQNYYGFLISSDGYYGVLKKKTGDVQLLPTDNLKYSEIINKGNATNHLSAICDDETLIFSINNEEMISVTDKDFIVGSNGLMIGSFENPNDIVVSFDNFILRAR